MAKIRFTKKQFEEIFKPAKQEETTSESEEKNKLKETIINIDNEYKSSPNRTYGDITVPNVVEKTYEKPSDEETLKKAEEEISPLYDAKMQKLTSKSAMEQQSIEDEKDELFKTVEESLKHLNRSYDGAKENASNEALKRGLARSSIILNQLNDLEQGRIGATGDVIEQRDKDLADLTRQIENLKIKLLSDTNELNEERAKEINERVEELVEKYRKEEQDVLEYNNKLRQQQTDNLVKLQESGIIAEGAQSEEYKKMIADKTKAFYSYYYSLGKDAATEMEKDKEYIEKNIGEKGYESLMRYFK